MIETLCQLSLSLQTNKHTALSLLQTWATLYTLIVKASGIRRFHHFMAVCAQMKENNLKTLVCSCEGDLSDAKSQDVSDRIISTSPRWKPVCVCVCVWVWVFLFILHCVDPISIVKPEHHLHCGVQPALPMRKTVYKSD